MATQQKNIDLKVVWPATGAATEDGVSLPPRALSYYQRIETYARRIRATHDVSEIIGILDEALRETHALTEYDELQVAADRVEQAEREITSLRAELQHTVALVQIDQLTQTLNRRGLDEIFSREAARSDRHGTATCLAVIDVDNFKAVNDSHGHTVGDHALVHLARILRANLRPVDVVARYGGEEFIVLLPDSDEEAAFAAISRVQRALSIAPLQTGTATIPITFSAGIARRGLGESQTHLIERADAALLRAKHAGKDRVFFAPA